MGWQMRDELHIISPEGYTSTKPVEVENENEK